MPSPSTAFAFEQLRIARDEILAYWESRTDLDSRGMWASDVRRAWNLLVEAFNQPAEARLFGARSALEQAMSTLVTDDRSKELAGRFRQWHELLGNELGSELERRRALPVQPTNHPVVRGGNGAFQLLCYTCGQVAATFSLGTEGDERDRVVYSGNTWKGVLAIEEGHSLFPMLERGDLASLHVSLIELWKKRRVRAFEDGLDVWCPDCSRVYCRTDYRVWETWDEGFFDAFWGRCPNGHARELAD